MQYFFDDSGNFQNFVKIWTRNPPNYHQFTLKIQENIDEIDYLLIKKNNDFNFETSYEIKDNLINLDFLNYEKSNENNAASTKTNAAKNTAAKTGDTAAKTCQYCGPIHEHLAANARK